MAAGAALRGLQEWCRRRTDGYPGVSITNMTSSFRDGLAFCALIHHHRPDLIDFHSLKQEDVLKNNHLAFSVAERELGIPALLDAEDMLAMRVPDRLSVITYVSQYYNYFNDRAPIGGATKRPSGPAESEPSTKKPTPAASAADKENVFKGNAAGAQRHSPARVRPGGSLASIGEGSPAGVHAPPTVAIAAAPPAAQGSTCTMCGLRVHLVQRHLVDGHLYHHNCFRCKECSNTLMPGTYKEGKEPGTYVCQHHRARSIYATTINAGTGTATTTATTTTPGTATTTTTGTAATTTTPGATSTTSSTSFLPSRLTSPSTASSSRATPGRDLPTIGKLNATATPTVSQPTTPSAREGRGIGATSPSPTARLTASPVPENSRTSEARDTFFLSTPASGQTAPGWERFEQKLPGGGSSDTPTSGRSGTPASPRSDKKRYEERDKAMENARQLLARRLPIGQKSTVAPTANDLSPPSSGKLSPTSRKRSPASGNLSTTSGEIPTVTPAGHTPIPLPRRTIPELVPSKWESSVSPVPKYTPSATPEKSPTRTRFGTGATGVSGGGGSSSSAGTSRSPVASLADSSVKTPGSIYADIVLRKATTPGQPAGFPEKSSASKSGAGAFGVKLRPTKSPTPVAGAGTTATAGGTTPAATKAPSGTASGTTTFVPESGKAQSVTITVTIPEQPRPVDGGGHRSTAQWEVPVSPPQAGSPGSALFGHGDTKGRGGSPSKTAETPKKTFWKKNPAPGYGYPPNHTPRRKPDTYMPPEQIQAELNSICLSLDEMQQRGVLLEAELRSCEGGDGEDELLVNWFRLIQEKNLLVRKESELAYISKQQILEERHAEVEDQIRRIMGRPEAEKDPAHEQELLKELMKIVHDRNLIVENLDRDRLRELEEDKALEDMLSTKDIFKSQEAGQETPKDTGKETPKEKKERKRAEQEKKDLEKKEKIRAEKERRDQEKQERQRAEKEQKEKEKQEKERQQKEKQEKEKQQKEKQKEKQEKSKKNKEKAENKKNKSDTLTSETENGKIEA
ncbi:MICAL-like protein 1 [Lampetra fluviatilis]